MPVKIVNPRDVIAEVGARVVIRLRACLRIADASAVRLVVLTCDRSGKDEGLFLPYMANSEFAN